MLEIDFRGKAFIRNYHLTLPFRPLLPAARSVGDASMDGSLIHHGVNLHALKALLPAALRLNLHWEMRLDNGDLPLDGKGIRHGRRCNPRRRAGRSGFSP